ncbi:MAG TPA: bifunctional hydroxymethylpyrimidine kinase/phosphomethylpyrimidine kinase [Terriglobia bacterium]|nr:bifunctional hydroxymethylpyrimidine kinase/phosphomethylpyrimidine kinase [Terriglobia bacterium]
MNHTQSPGPPVILTIAGFDPSCGAGVAADLKTFAAHNCYGVAAITALTVQNTEGVTAVHPVKSPALKDSIQALLADGQVKAVKIGMLATRANGEVVREFLDSNLTLPSVLDPVLRSSGGIELIDAAGFDYVREQLLKRVTIVTPNLAEAEALTGLKIENVEGMKVAARKLMEMGARAVVITGGHLEKPVDVCFDQDGWESFTADRVKPDNTHGTGCAFSSAIACNVALGRQLRDAVMLAKAFVTEAIRKAYATGPGRLPLNPLFRMQQTPRVLDHAPSVPEPVH